MRGPQPQKGKLMERNCHITPLEEGTWRLDEAIGELHTYAYLLEGASRAMLIDTCQGMTDLKGAVKTLTDKPVFAAHTHGHLDHIGGAAAFAEAYLAPEDLPVAQEHGGADYRRRMFRSFSQELSVEMNGEELERLAHCCEGAQYRPMQDGDVFDLGGRKLWVLASPGHTPGSVCFWEPERAALYTGDTVCARGVLLSLPHSCGVRTFRDSIRSLRARTAGVARLHPGHHEAPLDAGMLDRYEACAEKILSGRSDGLSGVSAGEPCLFSTWEDISLAYRPGHIGD